MLASIIYNYGKFCGGFKSTLTLGAYDKYGKFTLDADKHRYSASPAFCETCVNLKITSSHVIVMNKDMHEVVRHRRLYGEEHERMDWLPYLTYIARKPRSLRNSGIYGMMPQTMQIYMDNCENKERVLKILAELSTISVAEFYKQFCAVLGVSDKGGKPGMFKAIQEQVYYLYKEKRQPLLLAVDEAQYLSTGILNDIKMLMNYGYDSVNCFTLILCGEAHLNNTLRKPIHEALRQRITVHYNFHGLSDQEVADYVLHKISCAGGSRNIMETAALAAIHSHSQGNPRLVDNLMTDALALGAQMDKKVITPEVILAAVSNQNLV